MGFRGPVCWAVAGCFLLLALGPFPADAGAGGEDDVPSFREWAAAQPRLRGPDGREVPTCGYPYFAARPSAPLPSEEGGAGGRWNPVQKRTGTWCRVFVDTDSFYQPNDTQLDNITSQFDLNIWPNVTALVGTPGFPSADIIFTDMDGPGGTGGFFSSGNDLWLDGADVSWMNEIAAHEFQHSIHATKDSNEDLWVNEGCADLAIYICHGSNASSLRSHVNAFEGYPDNDLTRFQNAGYDYGSTYAFLQYFFEHHGGKAAVKALVADPANGIAGFSNRLAGTGKNFTSVFRAWAVANYLNDRTISDEWGYFDLNITVTASMAPGYPFWLNGSTSRWGADHVVFAAEGVDLCATFDGGDGGTFEVLLGKVGKGGVPSEVERLVLDGALRANGSVRDLGVDYSRAVLIIAGTSAGGAWRVNASLMDRRPPVTWAKLDPPVPQSPDGWYTRPPEISLGCNEPLATSYYRWDGGAEIKYVGPVRAPEGEHLFRYRSVDPSGNAEAEREFAVRLDTTPPVTALATDPPAPDGRYGWFLRPPSITLSSEPGARTFYRWDLSGELEYSGPFGPAEGAHELHYRSVDSRGNEEAPRSAEFRLDRTLPASRVLVDPFVPDGEKGWYQRAPTVRIETEDGGEVRHRWNDEEAEPYILPILAREGRNVLRYRAVDHAGNEEAERTLTLKVDSLPPRCGASASPAAPDGENGFYRSRPSVSLSFDADARGLYRWDGGRWTEYAGPLEAPEGSSVLHYYSVDEAGNRCPESSLDLSVDTVPPGTELSVEPDAGDGWLPETPSLALGTEPGASILYILDGSSPRPYQGRLQLASGVHELTFWSVDRAGNEEARRSRTFRIDLGDPQPVLGASGLTLRVGEYLHLDGSGSADAGSGVAAYRFTYGDGRDSGWTASPTGGHCYLARGVFTVQLAVRDRAGRESAPATLTVTVSEGPAPPATVERDPPAGLAAPWAGPAVLLSALAILLLAGAVLASRRRRDRPPAGEPGPGAPTPELAAPAPPAEGDVRWDAGPGDRAPPPTTGAIHEDIRDILKRLEGPSERAQEGKLGDERRD